MHFKSTLTTLLISSLIISSSCTKDEAPPARTETTFIATLDGVSESTPNPSKATGLATLTFNKTTKILSGTITFDGLAPTAGHIHKGAKGVAGPVILPFSSLTSPINYTSAALTEAQEADLYAGLYYVNLHTPARSALGVVGYPGGEIRGQLLKLY
jgi:CHRD domain